MELQVIQQKTFEIRGQKVMLDFDPAALYEVETKALNQAVKRNMDSFPEDFMFRLTRDAQLNQIYDAIENLLDQKVEQKSREDRERIGFKKQILPS